MNKERNPVVLRDRDTRQAQAYYRKHRHEIHTYAIHELARKIAQLSVDEDDEQLLTSATLLRLSNANSVDVQHRYQLKWVMICEPAPVKCKKRKER